MAHPDHRCLGDLSAGTPVIRERRVAAPEQLRSVLGTGVRRVQRRLLPVGRGLLIGRHRGALLNFVLGRDALDEGTKIHLFATVVNDLEELLRLPVAIEECLSDEKLVLLVTTELFES